MLSTHNPQGRPLNYIAYWGTLNEQFLLRINSTQHRPAGPTCAKYGQIRCGLHLPGSCPLLANLVQTPRSRGTEHIILCVAVKSGRPSSLRTKKGELTNMSSPGDLVNHAQTTVKTYQD